MRIRGITVHAANMAAERKIQESRHQTQREDGMFGVSCRVTISQEGRKRSGQQAAGVRQETGNVSSEKRLLRLQRTDDQYENTRNGYLEELEEIDDKIKELNNSFTGKKDLEETVEKQQKVLRAMRNQKQRQLEENQRREKEARQMAMQSGKYQEEIDENNRDLRTLLKSIEEAEKAKEQDNREAEGGKGDDSKRDTENSAAGVIRNSALQFTASSVRREWSVQEMIAGLGDEGRRFLDRADSVTLAVLRENEKLRAAFEEGSLTEEEMAKQVSAVRNRITGNYKDVEDFRGWGMQIVSDALDCRLQHLADDPLKGMREAKKSMMLSAMDAAVHDVVQGKLDETSGELEKEVEELIDERNNIDKGQDAQKDREEQEEAADEMLQPEEPEEGSRGLQR